MSVNQLTQSTQVETRTKLTLFALTWPIFIEIFLHMLMGNVNTMMLGQYSDEAAAAVGVVTQVVGIVIVIFGFVSTGTSILVSQYLGAGRAEEAAVAGKTALVMNLWFGIAISLVMLLLADHLLRLLNLQAGLMEIGLLYMNWVGAFLFLEALKMTMSAIARAHGHTKGVMLVTIVMNVLNVLGCWLVLKQPFGLPVYGVEGVAVSIIGSRVFGVIAVWFILRRKVGLRVQLREVWRLPLKYVRPLLQIGVPSAGEHLAYHSSQMMMTYFVALVSTIALSTKIYVQSVGLFLFLFSAAIGMGTQILVGHDVGAGDTEGAYRRCLRSLKIAMMFSLGMSLLFAMSAPYLFDLFTDNQQIIQLAGTVMALAILLEPGRCLNLVIINSLKAAGDTRFPVLIGVVSMWGISVPFAWYLGVHLEYGLIGVFIALIVDEWLRGLIMLWRWRSRVWERMSFV